jgi:dienelactone hydrolase
VVKPQMENVLEYLSHTGTGRKIGMVGFCWGGWVVFHTCAMTDAVCCAAVPHPSVHIEAGLFGGDAVALARSVQCPVHLLPAGNDPELYTAPGGAIAAALAARHPQSRSTPFPEMEHGWMPR